MLGLDRRLWLIRRMWLLGMFGSLTLFYFYSTGGDGWDGADFGCRNMEDFVTWVDSSKIKRNIMKYRDTVDDFDLLS